MKCDICQNDIAADGAKVVTVWDKTFHLCDFDATRIHDYIRGNISGDVLNIFWGAGHVCGQSWATLRRIIRENGIKRILEFGMGLSTELFVNEGLEVLSFDVWKTHVELYQGHNFMKDRARMLWYPHETTTVEELCAMVEVSTDDPTWDLVFVDGPQTRAREVHCAMKYSKKLIYLHDPNMGEQSFFPNENWHPLEGPESKLFGKYIPGGY